MILTPAELESLVNARHPAPHDLLGMHLLGDGSGVVVRALLQDAAQVEIVPTLEKDKPSFTLARLHETGLFEGASDKSRDIYAYDLVITDFAGRRRQMRDAYSFLPTLEEIDLFLFNQGNERRLYDKLGAHQRVLDGVPGVGFAVWAPNARGVSVVGDFNHWDGRYHPMRLLGVSGVWELFIPGLDEGAHYKFEVRNAHGLPVLKADPFATRFEVAPKNASLVWNTRKFAWTDDAWMERRRQCNPFQSPLSIYEVHLGSWRKQAVGQSLGYRDMASPLVDYVQRMGFTHVEFLPVAEH
ncbi:TPA: hypothetical protein ACLNUI_003668, partial [Vibrio cholerae O1]